MPHTKNKTCEAFQGLLGGAEARGRDSRGGHSH